MPIKEVCANCIHSKVTKITQGKRNYECRKFPPDSKGDFPNCGTEVDDINCSFYATINEKGHIQGKAPKVDSPL